MKRNPHIGSSVDNLFEEEGTLEQDLRKCHNWWLVRDATSLMTTFKYYRQSHTLQKKNMPVA
ncbi:hypothetical protein [Anabaena azotica]|uniref:Uncharacterized protein n=1 Tax=Anabaena azotica FACHB-119 TaxID=947527 RepID=A0ABR8D7G7_9NOST|nr:hypothetical protein [Anabaena azotica]MBD2503118.1 hypothetical protein [Anabaena azotica FACHB-119]